MRGLPELCVVALALCGCTQAPPSVPPQAAHTADPRTAQPVGQPVSGDRAIARVVIADAATLVGDQAEARRQAEGFADDLRRAQKMPDPARPIDHEAARIAARTVPGVRSVVWVDRNNLFAIVDDNAQRSQATIDAVCAALSPLGDTLGVVVNLQSGAARSGEELAILSRDCQLPQGERAFLQTPRDVDVVPASVREQVRAQRQAAARDDAERRRRQAESQRIIERSTPEM